MLYSNIAWREKNVARIADRNSKLKYEVIIYWSEGDQAFIAEVPELPGCAADGKTHREALANVEVIIREWIETARDLGRPSLNPRAAWSSPEQEGCFHLARLP